MCCAIPNAWGKPPEEEVGMTDRMHGAAGAGAMTGSARLERVLKGGELPLVPGPDFAP